MGILDTQNGRWIMQGLACHLSKRRMSRRFKRSFYQAFDAWKQTGTFSLDTLLNNLNDVDQGEISALNQLLIQLGCSQLGSAFNGGILFVDPLNGSDETGDGSSDNPFETLEFLNGPFFPKIIDKKIIIRVAATAPLNMNKILLDHTIGENGCLSLVGNGDPRVIPTSAGSGPFTLTGVTQIGTPVSCNNLQVGVVFGVNELMGKGNWLLFQSGACAGQAIQIHDNTANNIFTRGGLNGVPLIGDTFIVVNPLPIIVCPVWDIQIKGSIHGNTTDELSRFNLLNLQIDLGSASVKRGNFRLKNTVNSEIAFVTLQNASDQFEGVQIESNLNNAPSEDPNAQLSATLDVTNLDKPSGADNAGLLVGRSDFPPPTFGYDCIQMRHAEEIRAVDTPGAVSILADVGQVNTCGMGQLRFENGASGGFYVCYLYGANQTVDVEFGGSIKSEVNYLKGGVDAFKIKQGVMSVNGNTHGVYSGYGFRFDQEYGYVCTSQDPAPWAGTTGAIYFAAGIGTTAFPAANTRATDAIGNFFGRIDTP